MHTPTLPRGSFICCIPTTQALLCCRSHTVANLPPRMLPFIIQLYHVVCRSPCCQIYHLAGYLAYSAHFRPYQLDGHPVAFLSPSRVFCTVPLYCISSRSSRSRCIAVTSQVTWNSPNLPFCNQSHFAPPRLTTY
jgi:hypothetical protein